MLGADLASPAGFALQTKMPVVSNDLSAETRFRTPAVLAEHGIRRAINVIVELDNGSAFGLLEADASDRAHFTLHDLSFMQALANIMSAAIVRQRQLTVQRDLLREKDMLVQEVHHRVKNNLQLVQTMLHLQARSIPDGEERSRLQEAASRIMSIAAVHRRLHEEGAIEKVDVGPYLDGLVADMTASFSQDGGDRPITVQVEAMQLVSQHVTPVGLIVVELVTNALKYGTGPVAVRVGPTAVGVDISVEDGGSGFGAGFDPKNTSSLGLRLIAALARSADPIAVGRTAAGGTVITVRVAFAASQRQP